MGELSLRRMGREKITFVSGSMTIKSQYFNKTTYALPFTLTSNQKYLLVISDANGIYYSAFFSYGNLISDYPNGITFSGFASNKISVTADYSIGTCTCTFYELD